MEKHSPIYLDNNATTTVDKAVAECMFADLSANLPLNPSSSHSFGQKAKSLLSTARQTIANYLQVKSKEIFFTSGGTESMNFLIRGLAGTQEKMHILSSSIEHSCVEKTLQDLVSKGHAITFLQPSSSGAFCIQNIEEAIQPDTRLLVFSAVNSETGVKQDLFQLSDLAIRRNLFLLIDGVALLGKESFTPLPQGITGMGFSGHKCHGPKGIGFVFLRSQTKIFPLLTGGGQEMGLRSGTEPLTQIIGLAKSIERIQEELPQASQHMEILRDHLETTLCSLFPNIEINGTAPRICNVSNLAFPGVSAETLLMQLDLQGIAASHGSACSSGALEPSRILLQMGLPLSRAKSSVRFSLSRNTTKEEIDQTIEVLSQLLPQLSCH